MAAFGRLERFVKRVGLPLLFAATLVGGGCGPEGPAVVTDPGEAQRAAGIPIPPSASGLECRINSGVDRLAYGRFDIPAADLPTVLAGMPADTRVETYTGGYSNVTSHQISDPWWRPDLLRVVRKAEWSSQGFSINLLIGETGAPGMLTVYFFNFAK